MFDIAQFRLNFPEFADPVRYTDDQITFWAGFCAVCISETVFGAMYDYAWQLCTAHELVIAVRNFETSESGGIPDGDGGAKSSKAVGSVSVSYDTVSSAEKGAGYYNLTTYGKQYWRLVQKFGSGAYFIGGYTRPTLPI